MVKQQTFPYLAVATLACASVLGRPAEATAPTMGNVILTISEFTGSPDYPRYIAEFTPEGGFVQRVSDIPLPGGSTQGPNRQARGLVYGDDGRIFLYNGGKNPYLATLNPGTGVWTEQTLEGWSTISSGSFGAVDATDRYVFATDNNTGAGETQGLIRFDLLGGPTARFAEDLQPGDLSIGHDGILYAVQGGSSSQNFVHKYNPDTLEFLGNVTISRDSRGIAAWKDGTIFAVDLDGVVRRHAADGSVIDSLTLPSFDGIDLDISPEGGIVVGSSFGKNIAFTDIDLDTAIQTPVLNQFDAASIFVAWVQPPVVPGLVGPVLGDLNGDGSLTNADIAPFVQALTDPDGYAATYPDLDSDVLGDFTGDGLLTNGDIAGFVAALTGDGSMTQAQQAHLAAVPEPGSFSVLIGACLLTFRRRQ